MREVAEKCGVTIKILKKPLEEYSHISEDWNEYGQTTGSSTKTTNTLGHGEYYIEINLHKAGDLTEFWNEVDRVSPVKDPLLDLVDELLKKVKTDTVEPGEIEHMLYLVKERTANEKDKIIKQEKF